MTTRTVTGTVKHLDDTVWEGGVVAFRLLEPFATALSVAPKDVIEEVLDVNGQFTITLEVPDTGTAHYTVTIPDETIYEFYLASGPPTDLMTIITISGSAVAQDDLQTLLDTYTTLSVTSMSTNDTIYAAIEVILASGDITLTLPAATGSHVVNTVKNVGTGTITIAVTGNDLVDGGTYLLIGKNMSAKFMDVGVDVWVTL